MNNIKCKIHGLSIHVCTPTSIEIRIWEFTSDSVWNQVWNQVQGHVRDQVQNRIEK
jgi:hypothetical protein